MNEKETNFQSSSHLQAPFFHFQLPATVRHVGGSHLPDDRLGPLLAEARLPAERRRPGGGAGAAHPPPLDVHQGADRFAATDFLITKAV